MRLCLYQVLVTLKESNDFRNIVVDDAGVTSYVTEQQETTVTVSKYIL